MRKPIKVSGLISSGALTAPPNVRVSTAFDTPQTPQTQAQPAAQLGATRIIPLHLIDDSPYQPRRKYSPIRVDEMGKSLKISGLRTPITVRVSPKDPGRYESLKGHYRRRGATNIGWTEIEAWVVERNEREAKLDTRLDNEGEPLNEYEYARMFKDTLDDQLAKNQTEVGEMYACSQAKVSNCLSMLELPAPVLALLDKDSALFGAKAAKVITALWAEHPNHHDTILEAIDRLNHGAEQASIKGWVVQKLAHHKAARGPQRHVIPSTAGVPRYITQAKDRDIIVKLADPAIDIAAVHQKIDKMLRELEIEAKEKNTI